MDRRAHSVASFWQQDVGDISVEREKWGKDGFALQSGNSSEALFLNFEEVTTDLLKEKAGSMFVDGAPIIDTNTPANSALLLKAAAMLESEHDGTKDNEQIIRMDGNSFKIIERWIADGCPGPIGHPDADKGCVQQP